MLTHRYKRILFPVLFVKEMTLICPEAPSGCQNPQEFPKGIRPKMHSSDYWHPKRQDSRELFVRSVRWIQLAGEVGG